MDKLRLLTIILVLVVFCGCVQQKADSRAFFCPKDACEERTISAIKSAESTIDVAMYSFTSQKIEQALGDAQKRNVRVRVIMDRLQSASGSSVTQEGLADDGIETRIYDRATLHDKFAIIDEKVVLTGSYNWTKNANESNRENILMLFDRGIAEEYENEFFTLWIEAG